MLYRAILINTFGQRCRRPFSTAYTRLIASLVSGSILGILIARQLPPLALEYPNFLSALVTIIIVVQACVLTTLLVMQNVLQSTADTTARLLLVLPLRRRQLWPALLLPNAVIVLLTLVLLFPILLAFFGANLHPLAMLAAALLGASSAQMIILMKPGHHFIGIGFCMAVVCLEFWMISKIHTPQGTAAICLMYALLAAIYWRGFRLLQRARMVPASKPATAVGRTLPQSWWFIKKSIRAEITQLSCISGLAICIVLALGLRLRYGVAVFALPACLIAAAVAADIRSLSRSHYSAEIMLRGVRHFYRCELVTGIILIAVATLPLTITALPTTPYEVLTMHSYIIMGGSIGLFAGTVVAPGPRDISGQLLAALLCVGAALGLTILLPADVSPPVQLAIHGCITAALTLLAATVEYLRNPFVWRKS